MAAREEAYLSPPQGYLLHEVKIQRGVAGRSDFLFPPAISGGIGIGLMPYVHAVKIQRSVVGISDFRFPPAIFIRDVH